MVGLFSMEEMSVRSDLCATCAAAKHHTKSLTDEKMSARDGPCRCHRFPVLDSISRAPATSIRDRQEATVGRGVQLS